MPRNADVCAARIVPGRCLPVRQDGRPWSTDDATRPCAGGWTAGRRHPIIGRRIGAGTRSAGSRRKSSSRRSKRPHERRYQGRSQHRRGRHGRPAQRVLLDRRRRARARAFRFPFSDRVRGFLRRAGHRETDRFRTRRTARDPRRVRAPSGLGADLGPRRSFRATARRPTHRRRPRPWIAVSSRIPGATSSICCSRCFRTRRHESCPSTS